MTTLLVVADGSEARIYDVARRAAPPLTLRESLVNPAARLPGRALETDRGGSVFARAAAGPGPRSAVRANTGSDLDPHVVELERFARRVSRRLDVARRAGELDHVWLVAGKHFLGLLRQQLSGPTRKLVEWDLNRDLVRSKDERIVEVLRKAEVLPTPVGARRR
jgi:protein required for attachment to host cells